MKLLIYVQLLFWLLFVSISLKSYAQTQKPKFEHLTIEQGLSHNFVMYMMQDRKGYLWFGTGNGLDKYDGYRFTNYKFDPHDSTSVPKNQVFMMWEDNEGMIWVGTSEGTCRFDPRAGKFTRLEKSADNPHAFKYAQSFNEDAEGNLWVGGSFAGELRQIDRKTGKFSATNYAAMLRPLSDSSPKNTNNLHVTFQDKQGTLWVGSPSGLHRVKLTPQGGGKPSKVSFTHYRHDPSDLNTLGGNRVTGIYEDHRGILWIMTLEGVLNAFDPKSGKFTRFEPDPKNPLQIFGLLSTGITEDLEGNLWIGTFNGLYKLDKERKVFTSYIHDATDPGSIINNAIFSLLVDKSGILWVATMGGVDKLDPHKKPFGLYRHDPSNPHSLSHNSVAAIGEDKKGVVWVGTRGGGLNALDKRTGAFTHYRHDPKDGGSLRSDTASAILEDRDGNLWIGNGEALSLFDRNKKTFIHHPLNHPFLHNPAASPIYTIYEDRQGIFWLGTDNGIISFDRKTGKTISYPYDPNKPDRISDYWALAILEDSKGNLWIGPGSQALTRFDRKTGKFTHYKHDSRKPGSISSNTIPAIYEDSKGNLWFGTGEGGLCRFDYATETFTTYTEKHGLAGNAVFSILEDNAGNLWLGTNNGLSKFSPAKQTFTNYDADDGLQSKLFTAIYTEAAASKGKDGTLYFGGINGFNAFNPADIHPNRYVPPVIITQFKLFDKTIPGKGEAKDIELDYDQNFFSFEFAALNYTNSHKNQYAYQLEGVDKEWIYSGSRRLASYTDIGPGTYVFRVKGSNNDGIWNEQGTSVQIIIHPPFWRTWWAYTLYGLLFIAAVLLARREIVRREWLKANLKIKQVESDRLRELDTMKSHFFTNISHEFRTPLSLIQGTVEKLEKKDHCSPDGQDYQLISRNADRLLQLINQLLDLSKLEAGKLNLHPQKGEITGFFKALAESFDVLFEKEQITYYCQFPAEPLWVHFDPDKLEKIFTNLLSNALKFTPAGGEVTLSVEEIERYISQSIVKVTLQDSGIGIPSAQLTQIFDRFHQIDASNTRSYEGTGIGLALVKELVELHGGRITVNSAENKGTTFQISLPLALATEKESIASIETAMQKEFPVSELFQPDIAPPVLTSNLAKSQAAQVLVVEDHADLRNFISSQLSDQYNVLQAENGLKAYELALDTVPDIIISDLMMPGMDGGSLCQKLKADERTSHVPIILLTAKADWESKLQGLETGADDYLTKPFKMEELKVRVKNLLESRMKLRERFSKQINLNPQEITVTSTDERFLQRALSILETNMANAEFDVEAFSKEIGLSRTHLHRKLTALTGQAPNEFIRTVRLKRAASLLQQHQGNNSEIAYAVGFSTLNYFTKCFKDFYGVTPSEYTRKGTPSDVTGH